MKYLMLFCLILVSGNLLSQNCIINDWVRNEYLFDAQMLSMREIRSDTNHIYEDSVLLPTAITDKYLGLISAVYNQNSDVSDSIFNYYSIHIHPYADLTYLDIPYTEIYVSLDTSYEWVNSYLQDSLFSGNSEFDSITSLYKLKLKYVLYLQSNIYASIESPFIMNLNALVDAFETIEGVIFAEPNYSIYGEGNEIEADSNRIIFSIGWGDCPAGCLERHYWEFSVSDCIAEFIHTYGNPLSLTINTKLKECPVFPNPFSDRIFISNPLNESINIVVHSIQGELILIQKINNDNIDLSVLNSGIYILTIESENEFQTTLIVKR